MDADGHAAKKAVGAEQWRIGHHADCVNGCFELGLGDAEVISPEAPFAGLVNVDAARVLLMPASSTLSGMMVCNILW